MSMIRQVSRRETPGPGRISPISGRRSPLADVLAADTGLQAELRAHDIQLIFPFVELPRKAIGTDPDRLVPDVTEAMLERLRAGRAFLVIDHSSEGYRHFPAMSELIHTWGERNGVRTSSLLFVTSNPAYPGQYAAWCDEEGRSDRYGCIEFNAFVHDVATAVRDLDLETTEATVMHSQPRPYRFLSFNYATRPERVLVVAHLLAADPPDGLVSAGAAKGAATPEHALQVIGERFRTGRLVARHPALFEGIDFAVLSSRATLPTMEPVGDVPLYRRFDVDLYAQTYVSIVTETEMSNGAVRRITEKALKPFLLGHPAIIAGNPGTLAAMRELGFATFDPFIDESYDEIENPVDRLCAVLCEIDRLRGLSQSALGSVSDDLEDIRLTNLRHGHEVLCGMIEREVRSDASRLIFAADDHT